MGEKMMNMMKRIFFVGNRGSTLGCFCVYRGERHIV